MPATMRDVAALAGVSIKTVSRVVNAQPHIRPELAERVQAAIVQLGWTPNGSARTLRTGRTGVIAVGVADLRTPALATLTQALVSEIDRRGLQAAVEPLHHDPDRTTALLAARGRLFDGVALIGHVPAEAIQRLTPRDAVVLVDHEATERVDSVEPDAMEAAALAVRHVALMGRCRIALLGADRTPRTQHALTTALSVAGIAPVAIRDHVTSRRDGATLAAELLIADPMIDALLCGSDELALGALAALAARGIAVPDHVSVIGYGNLDDASFSTPSLTTIDPGTARLARTAIDLLAQRLAGTGGEEARRVLLPVDLIRRESTLGAGTNSATGAA